MLIKYIVQISNDLCKSHTGEVKKSQCRVYGVCVLSRFSCVQLFATKWTVACQVPLSITFSRQEYWSGLPCPPKGDLPDPWIESVTLMSSALAGGFFTTSATWEAQILLYVHITQAFSRIITFHLSLHSTTLTMKIILKIRHDFIFSQKFEGIFYGS